MLRRVFWGFPVLVVSMSLAAVLPEGTELEIRLKTRVASNAAKTGDPVEAVLIRPVVSGDQVAIAAGAKITGTVAEVSPIGKAGDRAAVRIDFSRLIDSPIQARVAGVDNARETVDANGKIIGILASETLAARMNSGAGKVAEKYAKLGGLLETITTAVVKEPDAEIIYEPGVEMTLTLTKAAEVATSPAPAVPSIAPEDELVKLVLAQPIQTTTEQGTPSDLTNLMFLGTEQQLRDAFGAAGWAAAAQLDASSGLETVRAVAEMRGYKEAPVSTLLLGGNKPDLVFQKQNNTFAQRHHLRIWRRPGAFQGVSVWVCAATHDTGIDFSPEKRNFIHRIESEIDRERAKVVSDLVYGGHVAGLSLVARPSAPTASRNATGDDLATDGRMAILQLN